MERTDHLIFYHGTRGAAANAILASGARDSFFEEIGAFDLGRQIYQALLKQANIRPGQEYRLHSAFSGLPGAEYSLLWKLALENLVAANDQSHFEYGHFFATLNIANAYRYVIRNPYGSEFIQALAESLNVLRAKGDALPLKVPKEYPEVARLIENPSPPVVIELKGVSRDRLMTAKGSPNIEYELESFREMQKYEGVNAPADFRIKDVTLADIVAIHDLRGWPAGELDDELWRPDERKVAAVRGAGNAVARRL